MVNSDKTGFGDKSWPRPMLGWYVVIVLTIAYILSYMDRVVLGLLIELIRIDFDINDTQVSLLGGVAFALFYVVMGLPLSRLADRSNRRNLIAISVLFWSCMTALCGLANSFWKLFFARVGVGIGEAGLTPAAHSVISDLFPPHRRHIPIAVYQSAIALGAGIAYIAGGAVVNYVASMPEIVLPIIGRLAPWQVTFIVVGFPGVFLAAWVRTLREPVRRGSRQGVSNKIDGKPQPPVRDVVRFLFKENKQTFVSISLAFAGFSLHGAALLMWLPTYFKRTFGWTELEIGVSYGAVILIFGTAGMLGITKVVDWLSKKGHKDALIRAPLYAAFILTPCAISATLIPDPYLSLMVLAPTTVLSFGLSALAPTTIQLITPNEMRAQACAVFVFINNIVGLIIGGTFVGVMTDFVFKDTLMLGYSLSVTGAIFLPISIFCLIKGLAPFTRSMDKAEGWINNVDVPDVN